jgi:hypothetical protein
MNASSKLRRICKTIYAAAWRYSCWHPDLKCFLCADKVRFLRYEALYIQKEAAYIVLHLGCSRAHVGAPQPQSSAPQANRRFEPPSRACSRALVSERGILRRSRFGPSEVRDVAPSAHRRSREDGGRYTLRRIATDALSGRSGLRARGLIRAASQATRTQRGAQAHVRRDAVYRTPPCRGRSSRRPSARWAHRDRTGCVGPPPQHRTRSGAQKKTIVTSPDLPPAAVSVY